jgi:hypothetical protein
MKTSKALYTAVVAAGLAALTIPAVAQTGSPNASGSREINQNQPPKGNIGTSSQDPDASSGMSGTSGAGMNRDFGGTGSTNQSPNAEIKNSQPPKGNIGTSSESPGGPSR